MVYLATDYSGLIDMYVFRWKVGGLHEQYGPLWTFVSDGATVRRGPLMEIFESVGMDTDSPIYEIVGAMRLLCTRVGIWHVFLV